MKKMHTVRTFLAGVLVTLVVVGIIPSAMAAAGKNVNIYPEINIYMDDQKLNPTDANGNPVEVFTYNGTTYLPVRAISEALGKPVQWDGSTRSVYIGKHASTAPAAWLSEMDYFSGTENRSFKTATSEKDNAGATHYHCITDGFDRTYHLNGQYSSMSGVLYQKYSYRSSTAWGKNFVEIYGDGKLLFVHQIERNTTGITPVNFNVDLTGVLELRVAFASHDNTAHGGPLTSLGDVALYS